jgi:methyltransferase (TIGR00027 family)
MKSAIDDVSDTSIWVATFRATESTRSDALFHDPLAQKLVGERGHQMVRQMKSSKNVQWTVVMRTVIIDRLISEAVAGGVDTILNLGAGLDTRPYRMELPQSLKWIEVDHSHIIELKENLLSNDKPVCVLMRKKLDLANLDERRKFFSEINSQSKKVLVLTEGVIPYLSVEETSLLAQDLLSQNNFPFWIVDYVSPFLMKYLKGDKKLVEDLKNAPFRFNPEDWEKFYSSNGWKVREMQYLYDVAKENERPFPAVWWQKIFMNLASAKRKKIFEQISGYALMERV